MDEYHANCVLLRLVWGYMCVCVWMRCLCICVLCMWVYVCVWCVCVCVCVLCACVWFVCVVCVSGVCMCAVCVWCMCVWCVYVCVVWEDMNRSYRLLHCNNKCGNPYVLSTILGTVSRVTVSSATLATTYSPTRTYYNGYQGYAVASGHILQKTTEGIALCRRCMTTSNPWTCKTMPLHVHMGRVGGHVWRDVCWSCDGCVHVLSFNGHMSIIDQCI